MKLWALAGLAAALAGCSAMGQLTVKDYRAKTGQRVVAGQAEPKAEYECKHIAREKQDWGLTGNMDRVAAQERVTRTAVDAAPGKGANYVHVMPPSQFGIGNVNVNAFSDARVAYYYCGNLPAAVR